MRSAVLAGSWYPGDPRVLSREVDAYVAQASDESVVENTFAVVAPHAGYRFSGATAGHAYRALSGRSFRRVILLGPSHRSALQGLALPECTHFATPLGVVEVDSQAVASLDAHRLFQCDGKAHAAEHSLEIHLPFLQRVGPRDDDGAAWKLLPIMVGQMSNAELREAGAALRELLDEDTVVVASSDFTHYGPNYGYVPFRDDVPNKLETLDRGAFELIVKKDIEGFLRYRQETGATICGAQPIALLLTMLPEDTEVSTLAYDTSGRMTGDYANSVSYVSLAFSSSSFAPQHALTVTEKASLLKLARDSVERWVHDGKTVASDADEYALTPRLHETSGAFVTLKKRGRLRGCIGEILPMRPLHLVVRDHAIDAATNDGRFRPVTPDELADIDIEISVLTPPEEIPSWKDIVIGRDGILISKGHHRAVFLPQVAPEQGWTLEQTLDHLAQKAGLSADGWRSGTRFEVFQAIVFDEP